MRLCFKHAVLVLCLMARSAVADSPADGLPPIKAVDFKPRVGFWVNQNAFFPIVLYDAPTDDSTLAMLREFGFNVLTCKPEACDGLRAKGFYGAIHVGKDKHIESLAGVMFAMGTDSPALNFKKNLLEQVAQSNAKVSAVIPDRPVVNAIGYWEDEPAGVIAGKLPAQEKYEDLVGAIDVSAPYLYPVPYQPIASVGEAVGRARAASGGKKPLLPILQLFSWEPQARYPTPAELRCMTFLALVEGAHGIGFYSYATFTGPAKPSIAAAQPELWNSVKKLNREIAEIGPLLIAGKEAEGFSLDKATAAGVKLRAIQHEGGIVAVLINTTPVKQSAKVVCGSAVDSGALKLDSGAAVNMQQDVATVTLEPFGVEIVRWRN